MVAVDNRAILVLGSTLVVLALIGIYIAVQLRHQRFTVRKFALLNGLISGYILTMSLWVLVGWSLAVALAVGLIAGILLFCWFLLSYRLFPDYWHSWPGGVLPY